MMMSARLLYLFIIYRTQLQPTIECWSHVLGDAPKSTLNMLGAIQETSISLIDKPELTNIFNSGYSQAIATLFTPLAIIGLPNRSSTHITLSRLKLELEERTMPSIV